MARVVIENLTKIYGGRDGQIVRALDQVSLTVHDKELLVLVGPSGCGKTTTLRLIAGLEEATGGTISVDGQVVNDLEPKERDVAMVFQNHALYPHMSVHDNLAFGLKVRKLPKAEVQRRVREAAERLGLEELLERRPAELSGGQRQRVALGRALVRQPKLLLLDEPLSNLDAPMRAQLRVELSRLHRELGITMMYVTHDQVEAMTLGDRLAVMRNGAIQQVASAPELYQYPANLFVAGFIGSPPMNFFSGVLSPEADELYFREQPGGCGLNVPTHPVRAPRLGAYAGKSVVLGLRPEDISLRPAPGGASPGWTIEALVERIESTGSDFFLHLLAGTHSLVARTQALEAVRPGQKLRLQLDLSKAHFFDPIAETALE